MEIEDIGKVISGGTPKTTEETFWGGDVNWVTLKDFGEINNIKFKELSVYSSPTRLTLIIKNLTEQIKIEAKEIFLENGGLRFEYVPCLNDNNSHINLMYNLVLRYL